MNRKSKMGLFFVTAIITSISLFAIKGKCHQMHGNQCHMYQSDCQKGCDSHSYQLNEKDSTNQNK